MIKPTIRHGEMLTAENRSTFVSRNARFLWLALFLVTPFIAWLAYTITPHEQIWQEILYSLLCLPIFMVFLLALLGSVLSFLLHRIARKL